MPPLEAALKGSRQIGFTIMSLTVSLIAVLIPLLFMGDVAGRLFREFAITLAVTIVISAVVVADADADAVREAAAPHAAEAPVRQALEAAVEHIARIGGDDRALRRRAHWVLDRAARFDAPVVAVGDARR